MSPAVREFVREDLEVSPEFPTLLMQYEGYFAQLAAEGNIGLRGLERIIWLPRLKQAAGDILSVIHRNLKADSHVGFAAEVFSTFAHFFVVNSNPHEGMSLAERVLNRIHEVGDLPQLLEIEAIDALGRLQTAAGFYPKAEINLKYVFPFWQSGDYVREIARCANNLAICCDRQGRFDESTMYYEVALQGFYKLNERRAYAQSLQNMAYRLRIINKWNEAHDLIKQACEIVTVEFPSEPITAKFLYDYAEVLYVLGNDKAMHVIKDIMKILENGQDTLRLANSAMLAGLLVKRNKNYSHINGDVLLLCGWSISKSITDEPSFVTQIQSEINTCISEMRLKEIPVFSEKDLELIRMQILTL
ncbi:MAG: tetratricopeptide repeat protein [Armatimonas sp.]